MTKTTPNIQRLIDELCPEGVELEDLGKIAEIGTGSSNGNEATENGRYPLFVRSKTVKAIDTYEFDEEAIVIPGEGGVGEIFHYINGKYALHQRAYRIHFSTSKILTKFAYYYLFANFLPYILKKSVNATVKSLRKPMIEKFAIPIPPLPIQEAIVDILDTFTTLEAELEAELEARRKQYEYYRDSLLVSGDKNSTIFRLGTLAKNLDSKRKPVTRSARKSGDIPYYGASGIVDYVSDFIFDGNYLLVSEDGANLLARNTPIAFSVTGKSWINNHAHILEFENGITQRFVEIYLNSIDLSLYISGAAQPKLNQANLNRIEIPLPAFAEQERIVGILDKFDALVNDISIGLPAEIKARRQQYEFYRDKLLTFKELQK